MSYCTQSEINKMFGNITDDIPEDMFDVVRKNADAWIDSNLKKNYVPIPTKAPNALRTAAIYYAASDVLLTLYQGEDLPVQYDVWFNKAQSLLLDYIEAFNNSEAEESELVKHQMVKHSKGMTYNQKRRSKRRWMI